MTTIEERVLALPANVIGFILTAPVVALDVLVGVLIVRRLRRRK